MDNVAISYIQSGCNRTQRCPSASTMPWIFRLVQLVYYVWLAAVALLRSANGSFGSKLPPSDRERERSQRVRYTASWAVEITDGGDKAADLVARQHGYRNLGKVLERSRTAETRARLLRVVG